MKRRLFLKIGLTVIGLLLITTSANSVQGLVEWEIIDDGESLNNATYTETPYLANDPDFQERYVEDYQYPNFLIYNSSINIGRDEANSVLWFSLRNKVYYGDRDTWPTSLQNKYFLGNYTSFSAKLELINAEFKELITDTNYQSFPLYLGEGGVQEDQLELQDLQDDYVKIDQSNMAIIDLLSVYGHDNFGFKIEIIDHPSYLRINSLETKHERFDEFRQTYIQNASAPEKFRLGNNDTWSIDQDIPLSKSAMVGGVNPSPNSPAEFQFFNLGEILTETLSLTSHTLLHLVTAPSSYAVAGASTMMIHDLLKRSRIPIEDTHKRKDTSSENISRAIELNRKEDF